MRNRKLTFSYIGIAFGGMALLLAIIHFWAGPFSPTPTLEEFVADKAVSIKEAAIAKLQGRESVGEAKSFEKFDADRIASLITALLGGIALILSVIALAKDEPPKAAGGAALLGAGALTFQFAVMALGAIIAVILIGALLGSLGAG